MVTPSIKDASAAGMTTAVSRQLTGHYSDGATGRSLPVVLIPQHNQLAIIDRATGLTVAVWLQAELSWTRPGRSCLLVYSRRHGDASLELHEPTAIGQLSRYANAGNPWPKRRSLLTLLVLSSLLIFIVVYIGSVYTK